MPTADMPDAMIDTALQKNVWLERALDAAHIGVWDWDLETDMVTFSSEYYRMAGYEPGDFPSRFESWRDRVHPDDLEAATTAIANYINGALSEYMVEFRYVCKDGGWMWIHSRGSIVEWGQDRVPRRFMGIHTDVTSRKVTEQRLAAERRFTDAIMDSVPGLLYLYSGDGQLVRWNRKHEELTGYSPEELAKTRLLDWYDDPADIERITAGVTRSLETGYAEADGNLRNKDGSHTLYHFNAVRLELDGQTYFAGIGLNVEAQRRAERLIADSETKYRSLFENMLHGFSLHEIITDAEGKPVDYRYIDLNPAFSRQTGMQRETTIGRTIRELIPDIEPYWIENFGRIAQEGGTLHYENFVAAMDKYFETVVFSPAPRQFAVLSSDITDKVRQKQSLEEANLQLAEANALLEARVQERTRDIEQANRTLQRQMADLERAQSELIRSERLASLGALVAGVAHEINTPIGVSVTAASFLEATIEEYMALPSSQDQSPEAQRLLTRSQECLRMILSNLDRASRLIRSFKQVSVDRTYDQIRRINLREYLDEIITSLGPSYRKTPHRLENRCERDVWLTTHPGAVSQIISNLLVNALQHAFPPDHAGQMELSVEETEDAVLLRFCDNGQGMEADTLQRIFDPFFTTKRGNGGSGLGLFIVHNLVQNELNGTIECESAPGAGTLFRIRLPKEDLMPEHTAP